MLKNKALWVCLLSLIIIVAACSESTSQEVEESETDDDSSPPSVNDLDPNDPMTPYIEDGEDLLNSTNTVLASDETGNELSCMSCHADGGVSNNLSFVGITGQYPKYDSREGAVITLEEQINESIVRTLNGEKLDYDGEEMRSIIAYLTYTSNDIEVGADVQTDTEEMTIEEIPEPDIDNGEELYEEKIADSNLTLWGDQSFSDGSIMSQMSVIANFIKNNFPEDDQGSLSDQEAADIAAFILSKERPEWEDHDSDWPDGDRPGDIITVEEREEIQEGTFDWSQISN
ncbi:c-type cytochrome [Virgibacillus natechei]